MANVIGFDPVAWSIDGGRHNADLLRLFAYAATSGEEGIVEPGDLKPAQLSTPGAQITIAPGAALVRNRSIASSNQTYIVNARRETRLDVAATGATGARSDLVVVRVKDPQYPTWPTPSTAAAPTFQYTDPFIIQNVPSGTTSAVDLNLGYSALAIARIDLPNNTATVTNAMITDLRRIAVPRSHREVRGLNNDGSSTYDPTPDGSSSFTRYPLSATYNIYVPAWATRAVYMLAWGGVVPVYQGAATSGYWRLNVGNGAILGDSVIWEVDAGNATNPINILNADTLVIPSNLRGTTVNFQTEARRISGSGGIAWRPSTSLSLDITFQEAPV